MLMSTTADRSVSFRNEHCRLPANIDVAGPARSSQTSRRRTEPDLGLIKQVEQDNWAGSLQGFRAQDQRAVKVLALSFLIIWFR